MKTKDRLFPHWAIQMASPGPPADPGVEQVSAALSVSANLASLFLLLLVLLQLMPKMLLMLFVLMWATLQLPLLLLLLLRVVMVLLLLMLLMWLFCFRPAVCLRMLARIASLLIVARSIRSHKLEQTQRQHIDDYADVRSEGAICMCVRIFWKKSLQLLRLRISSKLIFSSCG